MNYVNINVPINLHQVSTRLLFLTSRPVREPVKKIKNKVWIKWADSD